MTMMLQKATKASANSEAAVTTFLRLVQLENTVMQGCPVQLTDGGPSATPELAIGVVGPPFGEAPCWPA